MKKVRINVSKGYDIVIGNDIIDRAGIFAAETVSVGLAAIVTDDIVDALYGARLESALKTGGFRVEKYVFPHGEGSKNPDVLLSILNFLAEKGFCRTDTVFALGGGVAGDLAGFAAACYMRGTGLVQVPTTLLAAVDSSVGGKTAINLPSGKNLAGAFYQPDLVLCDYSLLSTLSPGAFSDGCAEIVKCCVIADETLFRQLKEPLSERLEDIITRCVEIKGGFVSRDERDEGSRRLLNFGHTVGHALEKLSAYAISHGQAVAAGMGIVARASAASGFCSGECRDEIIEKLQSFGLKTEACFGAEELWRACLSDKKAGGGGISLVIPEKIGSCKLLELDFDRLRDFIRIGVEE